MVGRKDLVKTSSKFNKNIVVYSIFGQPRLEIDGLLQSGGIIRGIWKKAIKQISSTPGVKYSKTPGVKVAKVLVLGLGAGTVVEELVKKWPKIRVTGIEIDPKIVEIGRRYFKLNEFEKSGNLEIIVGDAIKVISDLRSVRSGRKWNINDFDLIVVDLYRGQDFVCAAWQKPFIQDLKKLQSSIPIYDRSSLDDRGSLDTKPNGIIIFNHLFWGGYKKQAEKFIKMLEPEFGSIRLSRAVANLLILISS